VNTGTEPQQIFSSIENAMLGNPDVNGILSLECCSTPAAGDWVSRNNKKGEVKIVGFDLLPKTLQYVKDGTIAATIGQAPERQGHDAVKLLGDAINGKQVSTVDTGAEIVDSTNIDKFLTPGSTTPGAATPSPSGAATSFKLADRIAQKAKNGQKLVIRVSYHDVSNEFAPQIRSGVEKASSEFSVDATMIGPTGADAEKQVAELESLITSGQVDGLAISSVSTDALAPIINKALEAGIPVVTFNTDNPRSNRLAFVGQDLVQSGRFAGDLMGKTMGGKGTIFITTLDAAAQWSIDREKGAREALAKYPDIQIVQTVNTGTEPQQIFSSIENAMLGNPDVNGILSLECCSTPAAGDWVSRNNKKGEVKIVGFDLLPKTLQYVKDGTIAATIGQAPERQGHDAVKLLVDAINGKQVSTVDTGAEIVDSSNIDNYLK
jgi:simple sugar transport system substrate-binding protein/ribose transport system substrate-binding protein